MWVIWGSELHLALVWFHCWVWLNSWTSCSTQLGWHHLSVLTGSTPGQLFPLPSGTAITASKLLALLYSLPPIFLPSTLNFCTEDRFWLSASYRDRQYANVTSHRTAAVRCVFKSAVSVLSLDCLVFTCFVACVLCAWPSMLNFSQRGIFAWFWQLQESWKLSMLTFYLLYVETMRVTHADTAGVSKNWKFQEALGCLWEKTPNGSNCSDFHE